MRLPKHSKVPHLATMALLCASLGACKNKDKPADADSKAEAKAEGETGDGDAAEPSAGDAVVAATGKTLDVLDQDLEHEKGVVLGHVLLPNPAQILTDLKGFAPPEAQGFLDEAALKALVGMQMGERAKVVQNLDLKKAHGCAVVDIKAYEEAPVSCAIAYTGGAKQLVADMGESGKTEAEGHFAAYEVEGQKIYVDDLGEYVGVTAYPDLFAKTKGYLEKNIIARASAPRGDVEMVAYVGEIIDTYPEEVAPILDKMREQQDLGGATADPRLQQLQSIYADYNKKNSERTIQQFKDMKQVSVDIGVDQNGMMFGLTMLPQPGSDAAKLAAEYGGGVVDPALAKTAPADAWMLMLGHNERGAWKSPQAQDAIGMMVDGWAALAKRDAASGRAAVDEYLKETEAMYGNDSLFALSAVEGGLFGAVMVTPTKKPTRDAWLSWTAGFTPDAILGDEGSKYVTWSFEPEHAKVDGVAVDRWTIKPTDEARKGIMADMSDKDKKQLEQYVGELQLVVDRAEVDGRVVWTVAPKAEDAWMKRVVEAQKGKNSLAGDPGLEAALSYHPGAALVFGIDINGMLDWLRGIPDLKDAMARVPNDLGENLSDLLLVMEYRKSGLSTIDFVVSKAVIEDGVKLAGQLGGASGGPPMGAAPMGTP